MRCFCESCGMNEENFGEMNYSDDYTCHEPYCCRDCPCFAECMEDYGDDEDYDDDYSSYFDGE